MNQQEKCLKAVNKIIDKMYDSLTLWVLDCQLIPAEFRTNSIINNIELLKKLNKEGADYQFIEDQNAKIRGSIYSCAAWLAANAINKFPNNCRTPELYLSVFKHNKLIYMYTPVNLRKHLELDRAYDDCQYSKDGTCINCTKPFEKSCSYTFINRSWKNYQ